VGKGIGFVITDVTDRFIEIEWPEAGAGEDPPFAIVIFPIERRVPALRVYGVPTIREP
jgi:hypothetical protein